MTFEEWFEDQKQYLTSEATENLEKYEPEFRRVWNSAINEVLDLEELSFENINELKS